MNFQLTNVLKFKHLILILNFKLKISNYLPNFSKSLYIIAYLV